MAKTETEVLKVKSRFLSFFLNDEEFAVDILRVREIIPYDTITTLPNSPPYIRGVTNLRGSVIPVFDLAKRFDLPGAAISKRTCIVVVEAEIGQDQTILGLLVDAVSQVREFTPDQVDPPPSFGASLQADFLRGMGKVGSKFVMLLNLDAILLKSQNPILESHANAG